MRELERRVSSHEDRVALLLQHAGLTCDDKEGECWEDVQDHHHDDIVDSDK